MTIAAYTPVTFEGYYPPYFNATLDGDEVLITVRSSAEEDGTCGTLASIRIPKGECETMTWNAIIALGGVGLD